MATDTLWVATSLSEGIGPQMDPARELRNVAEACETAAFTAVS